MGRRGSCGGAGDGLHALLRWRAKRGEVHSLDLETYRGAVLWHVSNSQIL